MKKENQKRNMLGRFIKTININDIIGLTFNNYTVLSYITTKQTKYRGKNRIAIYYRCECSCGAIRTVLRNTLMSRQSYACRQCTYKKRFAERIPVAGTLTYNSWCSMRQRCDNKNLSSWKYYGGKGIKYSARWNNYSNFLEDMGNRTPDTTLDRIDSNGDYTKNNCRWASIYQQKRNTSRNRIESYRGRNLTLSEWAEITGIKYGTLTSFLNKNKNRGIGDALIYFRMNDKEKIDYNSLEIAPGHMYNGTLRSNAWIARSLGVTPGTLLKKKKETSYEEAIKYFKIPTKERLSLARLKTFGGNSYKSMTKTLAKWSVYLKCDRRSFAIAVKKYGFERAMKAYDINLKNKSKSEITQERSRNIREISKNIKKVVQGIG